MSKTEKNTNKKKTVILSNDPSLSAEAVIVHEYPVFVEWLKTILAKITDNWFTIGLAAFAVLIAFVFFYPSVGGDQDVMFHLRYGWYYVHNLTWNIDHSQFNWTTFNPDFKYVTWIGSSILYIFYSLLSNVGLYLLQYLVIAIIVCCFIFFLRKTEYRFDITGLLAILAVLIVISLKYLHIKPDMFSGLFFVIACLVYYRIKEDNNWKRFYFYPPLFLLWVNTHGGFIIGLFFISAAFAGELLNTILFKKARLGKEQMLHFAISVLISYVIIGLNPIGYGYFIGIIKDFFSPGMKETQEIIAEYGSFWGSILFQPAHLRFRLAGFTMLAMLLIFIVVCIYLSVKKKFFDFPSIFLVVFFYVFGMSVIRATQYFPLIWFFAFFYVYKRYDVPKIKGIFNFLSLITIFLLCVKIVHFALVDYDSIAWFGKNWEESYPVKEVEYIKKLKPPGNIWNDYLTGGYLLWSLYPDYKIFMDPRYGGYMRYFMPTPEELKTPAGVESYSTRFPFKTVIIAYHETGKIEWFLKADWRIVFLDKNALVMVHKSIIPLLPKEALSEDVSVKRFTKVTNPAILRTLFKFYVFLNPQFGREILELYRNNVRSIYRHRNEDLNFMASTIVQREQELQQKAKEKTSG